MPPEKCRDIATAGHMVMADLQQREEAERLSTLTQLRPIDRLRLTSTTVPAIDRAGRDVLLFENEWSIRLAGENNEGLVLAETADRLTADGMD